MKTQTQNRQVTAAITIRAKRLANDSILQHFNFQETTLTTFCFILTAHCFTTRSHSTVYNSLKMAQKGRKM
jgi:hypothetical protein